MWGLAAGARQPIYGLLEWFQGQKLAFKQMVAAKPLSVGIIGWVNLLSEEQGTSVTLTLLPGWVSSNLAAWSCSILSISGVMFQTNTLISPPSAPAAGAALLPVVALGPTGIQAVTNNNDHSKLATTCPYREDIGFLLCRCSIVIRTGSEKKEQQ
jgi:hypothetical protein